MMSNAYNEPYLIASLQSGNQDAFRSLYDHLHPRIYRFIYSFLKDQEQSEEILQETFIILWSKRSGLNPHQSLYPYLHLIARRLTIDAFRKASTEKKFKERLHWIWEDCCHDTEEQVLMNDLREQINKGMQSLPEQQRIVFQLSRLEGLSYDEIAQKLSLSRNTVRNHLVCALKSMKIFMSQNGINSSFLIFFLFH